MVWFFPKAEDAPQSGGAIPARDSIAETDRWDVEALYPNTEQWEADFRRVDGLVAPLEAMRGTLNTPEAILEFLRCDTELDRLTDKVYVYAHLRADENTADTDSQARMDRVRAKFADVGSRLAWARPEILANPESDLAAWTELESLSAYRYPLVRLLRRKKHTLSEAEESLLAGASNLFSCPGEVYSLLTNADLTFPEVTDDDGSPREMSQGRFIRFLQSRDRRVRREAFEAMYDTYGGVKNTVTATLRTHVKKHTYFARVRHHESALHAALSDDHVPVAIYEAMIRAAHDALPYFYRFVELRRRCLGLDSLDMYDMYVPIVPDVDVRVPFEQARDWVIEACRPLGDDYVAGLRGAFEARWIDRYENRGKRSGAYSSGCYDSLPYILMNYQGTLDDVFTLAHELGHSMHSLLARTHQPPQTAGYPIFIAEIASTLNEALLLRYLLETRADEPAFAAYLLNHFCDGFRGTVYRQTMFAEFEKILHDMDAAGEPLTPDSLSDRYYALNALYYGDSFAAERRIALEWARIPHFYYNFYVYKYATSFCASQIFARRVAESADARDRYLGLLRAGGSADPIDLIRDAGVDMADAGTLVTAFPAFDETVSRLAGLLGHEGV